MRCRSPACASAEAGGHQDWPVKAPAVSFDSSLRVDDVVQRPLPFLVAVRLLGAGPLGLGLCLRIRVIRQSLPWLSRLSNRCGGLESPVFRYMSVSHPFWFMLICAGL